MELLIVIAIIAVLAGLVSSAANVARKRAYVTESKAMIAALETAVSMYESDMGVYPSVENLVSDLSTQHIVSGIAYGPYIEFDSDDLNDDGTAVIDPWSKAYNYETPGTNNIYSFDIWSDGPDEISGTDDDIKNW